MLKKFTLLSALLLLIFASCRDYLTDVVDITPPEISTDRPNYPASDTVTVMLVNKSMSNIYVIGAYNTIEKQNSSNWDVYAFISCSGGCPELIIGGRGSMTARVAPLGSSGSFRFVCYYSKKPGTRQDQKDVIYSNEFSVGE